MTKQDDSQTPPPEMPAEVRAQIDAINKRHEAAAAEAAELKKQLTAERDVRRTRECIEKADKQFPMLGDKAAIGAIIKRLEDAGVYAEIEPILKSANEKANAAALFSQSGYSTPGEASAEGRLNAEAAAIAKRDGIPLPRALSKACDQNPQLYAEYQAERSQRA